MRKKSPLIGWHMEGDLYPVQLGLRMAVTHLAAFVGNERPHDAIAVRMPMDRQRRTRIHFLILAMLLPSGGCAYLQDLGTARRVDSESPGWQMTHLDLHITLAPGENKLRGHGTMRLTLNGACSSGPTLHLGRSSRFVSVAPADNSDVTAYVSRQVARIRFAAPQHAGSSVSLTFQFESGGTGCPVAVTPKCAYARCHGDWYPAPLRGDPTAPGSMTVVAPVGWCTISNGTLRSTVTSDGCVKDTWDVVRPAARSFAAGPYHVEKVALGDRILGTFVLSGKEEKAKLYVARLPVVVRALEARFGPYPYDSLSIVEVPDEMVSWNGVSDNGFILIASEKLDADEFNVPLIAHEVTHAWWGNYIRASMPAALMIDEAMAQYGAALVIEAQEGHASAVEFLHKSRKGCSPCDSARGYFNHFHDKPMDKALTNLTGDGDDYFLANSKGPWVYHMLRNRVGDEVFFGTLRGLVKDYGGRDMSLANLRTAFLHTESCSVELEAFMAQWLDRPGVPVLKGHWSPDREAGRDVALITLQQRGQLYALKLDIAVKAGKETQIHQVELSRRQHTYRLEAPNPPDDVTIDPLHRLLIQCSLRQTPGR